MVEGSGRVVVWLKVVSTYLVIVDDVDAMRYWCHQNATRLHWLSLLVQDLSYLKFCKIKVIHIGINFINISIHHQLSQWPNLLFHPITAFINPTTQLWRGIFQTIKGYQWSIECWSKHLMLCLFSPLIRGHEIDDSLIGGNSSWLSMAWIK